MGFFAWWTPISGKAFADGISLPDKRINCLQDRALGFGVGGRQKACFARHAIFVATATPK